MKITIEFDPTTVTSKVTSPTSVEEEVITQGVAEPVVQSEALDAGAYLGVVPEQGTSATTPQILGDRIATATGSPLPRHPDTFDLHSVGIWSGEGLDGGIPKG